MKKMKLNHYHLILKNPSGFIMLETDVAFTATAELQNTMKQWASIRDAHGLELWRGNRCQNYHKRVLDSNHHFTWEQQGAVVWGRLFGKRY